MGRLSCRSTCIVGSTLCQVRVEQRRGWTDVVIRDVGSIRCHVHAESVVLAGGVRGDGVPACALRGAVHLGVDLPRDA